MSFRVNLELIDFVISRQIHLYTVFSINLKFMIEII
jgi:hypothetical protein